MKHPELIAIPIIMLADDALTILGAKMSTVVYHKHFTSQSNELIPLWRRSVDQVRWFNPRHVVVVSLVSVLLVVVTIRVAIPASGTSRTCGF